MSYENKWEVEGPLIVAKLSKLQSWLYHLMCSEHQQAALVAVRLRVKRGSSAGALGRRQIRADGNCHGKYINSEKPNDES